MSALACARAGGQATGALPFEARASADVAIGDQRALLLREIARLDLALDADIVGLVKNSGSPQDVVLR
jgi:hypothetical protein